MKEFSNIDDILDFAIDREQDAVDFYNRLAGNARNNDMKKTFEQFAQEEMGHKARLVKIKEEGVVSLPNEKVADLKVADYVVLESEREDMNYEQALVLAMKREKAAFKLYMALSDRVDKAEYKELFKQLAQEESRHKLRFELEYDEYVLREN
ncbi:ferritin-like domain-containing protein [Tenuifilum thalassicum]|uniref:Rubrerythrin n=1 Tax=Tenuifilum thalassicum TaxID=2590900 RepID=A0A7D3XMK4_9BACT|nr:ferritin family protein [Tenuifilum thalassicum]QKG81250.1 rubrerythrin [Tenuifilum thalassicum]